MDEPALPQVSGRNRSGSETYWGRGGREPGPTKVGAGQERETGPWANFPVLSGSLIPGPASSGSPSDPPSRGPPPHPAAPPPRDRRPPRGRRARPRRHPVTLED